MLARRGSLAQLHVYAAQEALGDDEVAVLRLLDQRPLLRELLLLPPATRNSITREYPLFLLILQGIFI